ncbi:hypothetical protein PHK61_26580 [Actinomycetospora lutea]|nr:hypothetical protein [Actinomycetospora lutea]
MTQIPGEPLGQMMQRLDGTCFSHSGIAVRAPGVDHGPATHLASALAKNLPAAADLGGVRWDAFEEFWSKDRELYCVSMERHLRYRALGYLARFEPEPDREGKFSFVKLVTVAAGLRAVELHATDAALAELLHAASREVAATWAATARAPSYYCAELVASAYGRRFTRAEMAPPDVAGDGIGDGIDEPRWLAWLMGMLADEIDEIDNPRGRAWARLLGLLSSRDLDFLTHAVVAIAGSGGRLLGGLFDDLLDTITGGDDEPAEIPVPAPLGPPRAMDGLADPDALIPDALVTPRMLWAAFGHEDGENVLRIVRKPSTADRPQK